MTAFDDTAPTEAPSEEPTALPDDGELAVYQDGPRDAPALLLIHGTAASARSWEPMLPLLTRTHRVLRVDLLGCGRSARPADGNYAIPDQARLVGAALDRLDVRPVVVVGHSSGSAVATALAERRPDLVTALVVIGFGPTMAAYVEEGTAIDPARWPSLTDDEVRQAVSSGFAPGFRIPLAFVEQARAMDFEVFAGSALAIRGYLDERGLADRLAPLGRPLLVLSGAEDRRWRPAAAVEYRAVPGATVELLPGLGHSPNLEDPRRTAELVLAFAARHTTPVA